MKEIDKLSERIEKEALVSLHTHCPAQTRKELGLSLEHVGDATLSIAGKDPSILLNRVAGLGVEAPVEKKTLEQICAVYRKAGVARFFLHIYPETLPPEGGQWLKELGLVRTRGWMKFDRGAQSAPAAKTTLRVERIGQARAEDFGRITCAAFGMSRQAIPLLAGIVRDPRSHVFMTFDGDRPAGSGYLMVDGQSGWFEWGATLPEARGKGSQSAVMAARVGHALKLGCRHMFTETGEETPGDPQHSYHNIERAGFVSGTLRENWAWAPRR